MPLDGKFRGMRIFLHVTSALLLLAPAATVLDAQATVSGWYTETRVTTRVVGENGMLNSAPREYTTREWLSPLGVRREGDPIQAGGRTSTAYALERHGDTLNYQVDSATRTILVINPRSVRTLFTDQVRADIARAAQMKPEIRASDNGTPILGHRTRKVAMTVTAPNARLESGRTSPRTLTTWTVVDTADAALTDYTRMCRALRTGTPARACSKALRSEYSFGGPSGFTTYVVSEVVVWRRETMEASRFAVPEGYTRRDLVAETRAMRTANAELKRLVASNDPRDRARAKALSDSLLKELRRNQPPPRPLRENPSAVVIDGGAKKKP